MVKNRELEAKTSGHTLIVKLFPFGLSFKHKLYCYLAQGDRQLLVIFQLLFPVNIHKEELYVRKLIEIMLIALF